MHLRSFYRTIHSFSVQFFFAGATESGEAMGGWSCGNILPINIPKSYSGKTYVFLTQNFQTLENTFPWNPVSTIDLPILWKLWTRSFKRGRITQKHRSQSKCLDERKKLRVTSQTKDRIMPFLVRTWIKFLEAILALSLECCCKGQDLGSQCLLMTLSAYIPSWYTQTCLISILLATQSFSYCAASLLFF